MISTLCLALALATADGQANWPGFLGAGPVHVKPESIPLTWSPTMNIAWQAPLVGYGQSSPIVWGDRVFVTAVEGPDKDICHVLAFSLADGKHLWKHSFETSDKVKSSLYVSRAAPTPVVDGRGVYAFFESGDVIALSLDGHPQWQRSLSKEFGKFQNKFGLAASPAQTAEGVIILVDDEGPSYLIALAKADGKTLWKTERASRVSWSSPALVPVGGVAQVVCSSAGSVDGYDPATGKLLWTYAEVGGNTSATPLAFAAGQFLVGASAGREGQNTDLAKKSNLAMKIEFDAGQPSPKVLWRNAEATPTFGSPTVYAGHAYWINRSGVVYCVDALTGETRYTDRIKGSCWATPLGIGDRLYCFGKDGTTSVLQTGPKFKLLAENQLWDPGSIRPDPAKAAAETTPERQQAAAMFSGPVQYGVAAIDGTLLIRTGEVLYCIRQ
ncbi:MAG: PQQ-binding-like beta-propeller repeat protein [Pirellulaceae bacterium]|nr:PQQ-binding-like beta-propeller repeat protein [Pirellulaceae bacterium]